MSGSARSPSVVMRRGPGLLEALPARYAPGYGQTCSCARGQPDKPPAAQVASRVHPTVIAHPLTSGVANASPSADRAIAEASAPDLPSSVASALAHAERDGRVSPRT